MYRYTTKRGDNELHIPWEEGPRPALPPGSLQFAFGAASLFPSVLFLSL